MKIRSIETFKIRLPFRISFAHALASRNESLNLIVKITLDNGVTGWGESIPRDYVTGETIDKAEENVLLRYAKEIIRMNLDNPFAVVQKVSETFYGLGLHEKKQGASWCALELAILDATSRLHKMSLYQLLGTLKQQSIRYGATVPFAKRNGLAAILYFYKAYGYKTVKLKVGDKDLDKDVQNLALARRILGNKCLIRVDANCAWNLDKALRAVEAFSPFNIASYEQPLAQDDLEGLVKLTSSIEEDIVLDESLCTFKEAEELCRIKACNAFNIRVSKLGGMLSSQKIIDLALSRGLRVHLGAQVGETGILSSAARQLAVLNEPMENYEGSANFFLLKRDICRENLTAGPGGLGDLAYASKKSGLGITIIDKNLQEMTESQNESEAVSQTVQSELSQQAR